MRRKSVELIHDFNITQTVRFFPKFQLFRNNNNSFYKYVIHYFGQKRTVSVILKSCINSTDFLRIPGPQFSSYCETLCMVGYGNISYF